MPYIFIVPCICRMWCNGNIRDCGSRVEGSIPSDLPTWGVSLMVEQVVATHQVSVQVCYFPPYMSRRAEAIFIYKVMLMTALSRTALMSLVQATNHDEIPKSVVDYWFTMYGKWIDRKEAEELEQDEKRL